MDARNLLTVIGSNFYLNIKRTLFPAIILLFIIPLVYGTSHLNCVRSADCLERMTALIGLPLFIPLLKPEQDGGVEAVIALRPFSYRITVVLRIGLSLVCAGALIFAFEGYMRINGCSFPVYVYTFRTMTAAMTLGSMGLLVSAASKNTIVGFLASFCWYYTLQTENIGAVFKSVSNGISVYQLLLLLGNGAAILFFSGLHLHDRISRLS